MATKHKHRPKQGVVGLLQQAQRALEKGNYKQALKDAKVCHRQQPSPDSRRVLERAYLARGRELYRAGLRVECRAVVESLLELGVTEDEVRRGLPELLVALGLTDRLSATGAERPPLEQDDSLLAMAADHAVLHPREAPASLNVIRQGSELVRRALAALEAGQEAEALAVLRDIPRTSPFADWKLFVRGLAAYYREDAAEMQANWERLAAERFAARIAAPLIALVAPDKLPGDPRIAEQLHRLGREVLGGPVLNCLQKLQHHLSAGRWREAVKMFRSATPLLREADAGLPQRVAAVLYATFARKGAVAAVGELTRAAEPPPLDPRWHRSLALACEQSDDDAAGAERQWRAYLEDLAAIEALTPAERTLARALVWLRLGQMLTVESCPLCPTCGVRHRPDPAVQSRARACFEQALRLAPEVPAAYRAAATAFEEWEEPEKAAAVYRRLVERFPEDLEGLLLLAEHHLEADEPFVAREFILRAERLKPLDAAIKAQVRQVRLESARHYALAGRWPEGREELAAAGKIGGTHADAPRPLVCRAVLEFKAGDLGLAQRLLDEARRDLGEAAPVELLATIEGLRYALPKAITKDFDYRWRVALRKKRNSRSAGAMCRIMAAYLISEVDYPHRDRHVARLLDFLAECSRTRWQPGDLRNVLEFLLWWEHEEREQAEEGRGQAARRDTAGLLAKLAARGRAKFPGIAFFQWLVGELEMRKGPWEADCRLARACLEKALELAQGATDDDPAQVAKRAKKNLHMLEEFEKMSPGGRPPPAFELGGEADEGPGAGGPSSVPPKKLFTMFAEMCRSLGLDPEEVLNKAARGKPLRFRADDD